MGVNVDLVRWTACKWMLGRARDRAVGHQSNFILPLSF